MKIDSTRMTAAVCANAHGDVSSRASSISHGVRRATLACVLAGSAIVAFGPVQAQDRGGYRKDDQQQQHRDDRGDRSAQRQDGPRYESRPDDARRQQQDHGDVQRRSGRLTPDERRDLRRQINEAGIDLYPNTPPRR